MENGWSYHAHDSFNTKLSMFMCATHWPSWLSQVNHIFRRSQIESNFGDCVLVYEVGFTFRVPIPTLDCPPGYLFLCPPKDFQVGATSFRWPDLPAYWSLHASGAERLSVDEATRLGFPPLRLTTEVVGRWWDAGVYTELRQFHQAKGFEPESQEVSQHVGNPLSGWKLSLAEESLFAHDDQDAEVMDAKAENIESRIVSEEEENAGVVEIQVQVDREVSLPSNGYKFLMNMKLALFLFLAMCWLYAHTQEFRVRILIEKL
ncbi:hypothetical protein C8R46DRAFT_1119643 [Mycena filopes]|nr:hypothetical protein C8R46DRAFT_1119643 [Mycena filopes]